MGGGDSPFPHSSFPALQLWAEQASPSLRSPTPVGVSAKSSPTPAPPAMLGSPSRAVPAPVFVNQAAEDAVIAQQKTRVQMLGNAGAKALNEILVFQTEPEI